MDQYRIPVGKELRIAVSGKSGCGNTTVSTLLAKKLKIRLINFTFRQLAVENNMTLAQVIEAAKCDDSWDKAVDKRQVEMALEESCVLGSRLAVWMLKEADFKIFLLASDDERAQRILKREGGDLEKIKSFTQLRDSEDSRRYKALYAIDNSDYDFCDLIIDTAQYTPEEIVSLVLKELEKRNLISCL